MAVTSILLLLVLLLTVGVGSNCLTWTRNSSEVCVCGPDINHRLVCSDCNLTVVISAGYCMTFDTERYLSWENTSRLLVGGCPLRSCIWVSSEQKILSSAHQSYCGQQKSMWTIQTWRFVLWAVLERIWSACLLFWPPLCQLLPHDHHSYCHFVCCSATTAHHHFLLCHPCISFPLIDRNKIGLYGVLSGSDKHGSIFQIYLHLSLLSDVPTSQCVRTLEPDSIWNMELEVLSFPLPTILYQWAYDWYPDANAGVDHCTLPSVSCLGYVCFHPA